MYFVDENHKQMFEEMLSKYQVTRGDTERYSLLYLLTSTSTLRNHIDDCVRVSDGRLTIKMDALKHSWVTGTSAKLVRLGFNLYNWGTPTAYIDGKLDNIDINEMDRYTPVNIFIGLDDNLYRVAITALDIRR